MHEFSLVKKEVDKVIQTLDNRKVTRLIYYQGKLAHGTPESIREAFKVATQDSVLAGVELKVVSIEPKVKCLRCAQEYGCDIQSDCACPGCGSLEGELISGNESYIESIEVES